MRNKKTSQSKLSSFFFFFFLDWAFFLLLFFIGFTYDSMGKEKDVSSIKYT